VQDSEDPEGLRVFYYLVQDLKALVFSLIGLHFKVNPLGTRGVVLNADDRLNRYKWSHSCVEVRVLVKSVGRHCIGSLNPAWLWSQTVMKRPIHSRFDAFDHTYLGPLDA
jgi:hypothetical protein